MKKRKVAYPLISVILIILASFTGYKLGYNQYHPGNLTINSSAQAASLANAIFSKQEATIQGQVTKVVGETASVENNNHISSDFPIAKNVVVYSAPNQGGSGSAEIGISHIPLNTPVVLSLDLVGSYYQIVSVFPTPQLSTSAASTPVTSKNK